MLMNVFVSGLCCRSHDAMRSSPPPSSALIRHSPMSAPIPCWLSSRWAISTLYYLYISQLSLLRTERTRKDDQLVRAVLMCLCVFVQVEVENFVLKMAAEFPSRKDQLIFLINNYDMLLSVLMVRLRPV